MAKIMTFKDLGLKEELLKAVEKQGYETPSTIQEKAIPIILDRKDVLASSQTGTGKTAGFVLPILQILSNQEKNRKRQVKALILTPTRELAAQIYDNAIKYAENLDIRSTVVFGGVNINPQINTLRNGVDILVATPGRLLDLYGQKAVSLNHVEVLVLDEADRMLDMGFARDIKRVLALLPERRQNLLFSATFSLEIKQLASGILHNPEMVEATPENTTVELIDQEFYRVDAKRKTDFVIDLIYDGKWEQVLIFTRTKHGANKLTEKLIKADISAAAIHGNKTQNARTKALDDFKKNKIRVLVATDIAARGLDIPLLPHVINYELPNIAEDYVHRIGRTGRAGASGQAISLVCIDELEYMRDIAKLIDLKIAPAIKTGYEPTETELSPKKPQGQRFDRSRENAARKPQTNANSANKKPQNRAASPNRFAKKRD